MNEHSTSSKPAAGRCIAAAERIARPLVEVETDNPDEVLAVTWQSLDEMVRLQAQAFIQEVLEEEVAELLGRRKSERIAAVVQRSVGAATVGAATVGAATADRDGDAPHAYRNGYGKPRQLSTGIGTLTVRRPRVRGLEEPFVSRVLPLFKRHTSQVSEMLPRLYLHGLSQGDFDLALRGLLGEAAPLSSSSIGRLKTVWQAEYEQWKQWKQRPLDREALGGRSVVYVWVDGVYVKAGLEREKAALLVVIGALSDGAKEVLAVEAGHRESTQAWSSILRDLKKRGMNCPKLVVGDGHLGIWGALANVFPEAREQRCWNHRVMNVLDRVSKKHQATAREMLRNIQFSQSQQEAQEQKRTFQGWARQQGQGAAAELLEQDWERMVTFYSFPKEHW